MFDVGTRVRTRTPRTSGHTRLPGYLAQRSGRVIRVLGEFRFADEAAAVGHRAPQQRLYTVQFESEGHTICADLFESYLEADE